MPGELLVLSSRRQRRHRLETPFLIRDAPEGIVPIVDNLSLPSRLLLFPVRPGFGSPGGTFVHVATFEGGRRHAHALRVKQSAPGGYGQEVELHGRGREPMPNVLRKGGRRGRSRFIWDFVVFLSKGECGGSGAQ